jgi:hypothetical protein
MDQQEVARQTETEYGRVSLLMRGLREAAARPAHGPEAPRKLSGLRFLAQSFRCHLERLLALEEHDGYLELVPASDPRLSRATEALRGEHQLLRAESARLAQALEGLPEADPAALEGACADLLGLLRKLEEHGGKEVALLQEALGRDGGGEG